MPASAGYITFLICAKLPLTVGKKLKIATAGKTVVLSAVLTSFMKIKISC